MKLNWQILNRYEGGVPVDITYD